MNWQEIRVSSDNTYFLFENKPIFNKVFLEVLKFHAPGIAPVKDLTGAYHIDSNGKQLYIERYSRTFGYYCRRAAVVQNENWFHLTDEGVKAYPHLFSWVGNFQENICTVRDFDNHYFHVDQNGERLNSKDFLYAGDFKDGIACVKTGNGFYKHINCNGAFINDKEFTDLGIFHKGFATAKDIDGWHHIDKHGSEIYPQRYFMIEPFYNGFALVTKFDNQKVLIDETGIEILNV
jgi:hypothetical protein